MTKEDYTKKQVSLCKRIYLEKPLKLKIKIQISRQYMIQAAEATQCQMVSTTPKYLNNCMLCGWAQTFL